MTETWKRVPSNPLIEASSFGRVRCFRWSAARKRRYGGKEITGVVNRGKMEVTFLGKRFAVHRLVCEAFNGRPPPEKPLCLHLDENFRNNRPENLAWGTQSENMMAPKLRASWTPAKEADARRRAWETRRQRMTEHAL
ncbi:MAG: HNH endonuclease signature motif containing protein [Pseudomonadota bacterium]